MKNTTIDSPAKVGCPSFRIELREVFPDQIDALGTDCFHCSLEGHQVTVNLYLHYNHGDPGSAMLHCCRDCVVPIVLYQSVGLDCDKLVIAEWSVTE